MRQLAKDDGFLKEKMNVVKNVMINDDECDWGARGVQNTSFNVYKGNE